METSEIKRTEEESLIVDYFFERGHIGLKIRQLVIVLFAWLLLLLPFWFILFPILFQQDEVIVYNAFEMAIHIFNILKYYYLAAIIFIIIMFVCLTIWNNRTFKQHLQKEATYNVIQAERREQIMEKLYHERFGPKKQRELVRYYSVSEEQNFLDDDIEKLYKENEVPLK